MALIVQVRNLSIMKHEDDIDRGPHLDRGGEVPKLTRSLLEPMCRKRRAQNVVYVSPGRELREWGTELAWCLSECLSSSTVKCSQICCP